MEISDLNLSEGLNIKIPLASTKLETALTYKSDSSDKITPETLLNSSFFGTSFSTDKTFKDFTFIVKIGNLSFSNGISKLHNPFISSSISPFSVPIFKTSTITASLPGTSSSKQPVSYYFYTDFNIPNNKLKTVQFSGFYIPDDKFALSESVKIEVNKVKFNFSNCFELYNWDGNKPSTWFSKYYLSLKDYYFPSLNLFSCNNVFSLERKDFSSQLTFCFYENPFGGLNLIVKNENKLKFNKLTVNISGLIDNNKCFTVTGAGKKLENCIQTKGGAQYQFTIKRRLPYFCKIGTTGYLKLNIPAESTSMDFKISTGGQITSSIVRANIILEQAIHSENSKIIYTNYSLQVKNNWYLEKIYPSFGFTFGLQKNGNSFLTNQDFKLGATLFNNPKVYLGMDYTLSQKNFKSNKNSLSGTLSFKYTTKGFSNQTKINMN